MNRAALVANVVGWPAIQLIVGAVAVRLPDTLFGHDTWITAPRAWERDGKLYCDLFAIRRWKRKLPDGAAWVGGVPKNGLMPRDPAQLTLFLAETRRAEIAHWGMLACLPIFLVWNPRWARLVMTTYAVAANVPCIVAQRYNRLVLARMEHKLRGRPVLS